MLRPVLWGGPQFQVDNILSGKVLNHFLSDPGDGGMLRGAPAVQLSESDVTLTG